MIRIEKKGWRREVKTAYKNKSKRKEFNKYLTGAPKKVFCVHVSQFSGLLGTRILCTLSYFQVYAVSSKLGIKFQNWGHLYSIHGLALI